MSPLSKKLNVALIQLSAGFDKAKNLAHFKSYIDRAIAESKSKVDVIVLPECFNSPYSVKEFRKYAEKIPDGQTTRFLADIAKTNQVYIVGGSIPELGENNHIYNTSVTFDKSGDVIGTHRKAHLFDIDIPGLITFKESTTLSAGASALVFQLGDFGKVGVGICYDIRFPELATISARQGAFAQIYPGAFNTTTGPLHWHLLARARAVDNQMYVVLCSPARDVGSDYHAYGHSLVVDPYGKVVAEAGEGEEIVYAELDPAVIELVRSGIPVSSQRRFDIYSDVSKDAKVNEGR